MRYMISFAYNGAAFNGWQKQPNAVSIQEALEKSLSVLLKNPVALVGSGRTDTGVHAEQQYAHFEWPAPITDDLDFVAFKANRMLPPGIVVYRIFPIRSDVHARFTATSRKYEYRISRLKNPFRPSMVYSFSFPLDVPAMNQAAEYLLRYSDFQSFSLVNTQVKTFRCAITEARWEECGHELVFHVRADRFLRGMVRALVGTLMDVGRGRITVTDFEQIILAKDRKKAGRAVPPDGLFLVEITYPVHAFDPPTDAIDL
ncbi:tRNA pseudouridine(38-40) synthase TruA [Siphonobacter sp.]|uniref:tRNA pseudouridine(38-40) synthase TruA n=1 Tax=Siphonobacter sp. TaxID=1869184 RepID=UPI003B3A42F0